MTSTQGRGVYLMPTIWDGQGYGNDPGKRLMVVEMRGVPTLQLMDDPVQHALATAMPTLADHKGTTSKPDALQELGAYDNRIRGEYLLKYTDKQYRLSTKKDVRVHDNLKRLPESLLREAYHKLTSTGSRVNFVKQMIDSGFPKDFFSVPKSVSSSSAGIPAPPPMPPKKQP